MTLVVGDRIAKIKDGKIVEGEGHRIFEVLKVDSNAEQNTVVTLKVIE